MNIIRVSKQDELNKYFNDLVNSGLISYPTSQYKKWYWQYMENPSYLTQDPPTWTYVLNGRSVGHLGAIPIELKVGSRKIIAAWAVDLMTLLEYRRKGVAKSLVEEANRHFDLFLAVGATDMSFNLFMKMGWKFLGDIPYYIKIWDLKTLIKERFKNTFMANLVFVPTNIFLKIFNYLKRPKRPRGIEVYRIENFSEEIDLFWEEIAPYYRVIVPRNKAYLNWKYDRQPDMHYIKFRATRSKRFCGYAVARCLRSKSSKPEGLITDIITRPDDRDAIYALLFTALEYLKSESCSIVRCYISHRDMQKILSLFGFIRRRPHMRFLINKNVDGLEETDNLDNWHITAGDSDIDR